MSLRLRKLQKEMGAAPDFAACMSEESVRIGQAITTKHLNQE